MIYFDDSVLPLHGVTDDIGLNLAAHFYNSSIQWHRPKRGGDELTSIWTTWSARRMVYDIERGKAAGILPLPWQTDTCIGSWHYDQRHFRAASLQDRRRGHPDAGGHREQKRQPDVERAAATRRHAGLGRNQNRQRHRRVAEGQRRRHLRDAPVEDLRRRTIDADRREGPFRRPERRAASDRSRRRTSVSRNPRMARRFTPSSWQFRPTAQSPSNRSPAIPPNWPGKIGSVHMLGRWGKLKFTRDESGLHVTLPEKQPGQIAFALKIQS